MAEPRLQPIRAGADRKSRKSPHLRRWQRWVATGATVTPGGLDAATARTCDLAAEFGVSESTIYYWRDVKPRRQRASERRGGDGLTDAQIARRTAEILAAADPQWRAVEYVQSIHGVWEGEP